MHDFIQQGVDDSAKLDGLIKENRKPNTELLKGLEKHKKYNKGFYSYYKDSNLSQFENTFTLEVDGKSIGISCLNTSWFSYDDNDEGNLMLGRNQIINSPVIFPIFTSQRVNTYHLVVIYSEHNSHGPS